MSTAVLAHVEEHHDPAGSRFGMWLFLFTEILLFAGVFLLYAVYRSMYPEDFHYGGSTLHVLIGGVNTLILLTSSLTMVLSIAKLERGLRRGALLFLGLTVALGLAFLVIKGFEWGEKIGHGIYPGSVEVTERTAGENIFYGLYFGMTGLHAFHVMVGVGVLIGMMIRLRRPARRHVRLPAPGSGDLQLAEIGGAPIWSEAVDERVEGVTVTLTYTDDEESLEGEVTKLENAGLYWHLVDVIWIFLFPLLYLIT